MTTIDITRQPALSVTELLDMDDVDLRIERLYYREQILRLTAILHASSDRTSEAMRRVGAARARYEEGSYAIQQILRSRVTDQDVQALYIELRRAADKLRRLSLREDVTDDQLDDLWERLDKALQAFTDHGVTL